MTDYLAIAAQAAENFQRQTSYAGLFEFLMLGGFAALHAMVPLIAGLIYAHQWRTLLKWVSALAGASFAANAGQELWANETFSQNRELIDILGLTLIIVVVPAFGAATIGIVIRKVRDRLATEHPAPEAQL